MRPMIATAPSNSGHKGAEKASPSCRISVQLSKKQIDKASEDNSGRIPETS